MTHTALFRSMMIAAALLVGGTAAGQSRAVVDAHRPAEDAARDATRRPDAMLAFAQVKAGDTVVDMIPGHGYFTRLFAVAVKPGGKVIAIVPAQVAEHDPEAPKALNAIAADPAYGNVSVVPKLSDSSVSQVDVLWTAQNYHDLHNLVGPGGILAVNKAIFAALKPGGVFVVVDHVALAGSGDVPTKALHRIDPAMVKAEVLAAGFVFDGESDALRNPADAHDKIVFDPAIRGHTDQFAYRFRKPR